MERRRLATREGVLEDEERAIRLLGGCLPRVQAAAEEPAPLAFTFCANDRTRTAHGKTLPSPVSRPVMVRWYHEKTLVPSESSMLAPSPPRVAPGRTQQKLRTRKALIAAARELITQGASPTVEDAAAASSISRTTAYRYFRNQAELLAAAHPEIHMRSFLPTDAPSDPVARLDAVVTPITRLAVETEPQQRTMLRLSLDPTSTPA